MIRATIVLLVAHAIVPRLRRCSAAQRHLLWAASLATAAVLPLLALVVPAWRPEWATRFVEAWPVSLSPLPSWAFRTADVVLRPTGIEAGAWSPVDWAVLLWALGSSVALFGLAVESVKLLRLLATARPVCEPRALALVKDVATALDLGCAPLLLQSPQAMIPMTWGARRCRVLLPEGWREWPDERLRAVLAHELAHIRRTDWLVHLLAQIACTVYWYHPLFWTAERALRREGEHAADDHVLSMGFEGSAYAAHLLEIVRASRLLVPRATVVAMAHTSHLERRVTALLNASANRACLSGRTVAMAGAIATSVAIPLAAMTIELSGVRQMDVVVRMLDLPAATPAAGVRGDDPARPAVRHVGMSDGGVATSESIVAPAIAEYTTPALYSDLARQRRIEGVVTIGVRVDEGGSLLAARVVKGLGFGLDQNALVALRQWQFTAGTRGGRPAAMDAEIDIEFDLRSEAINELIANDMVTLVGPGVTPPRVVRTVDIPSRVPGARGTVLLDVVLLEDGSPKIVRILKSLSPEADESAVRHFEQWRFSPATRNGVPVKVRMNAEVRFHA